MKIILATAIHCGRVVDIALMQLKGTLKAKSINLDGTHFLKNVTYYFVLHEVFLSTDGLVLFLEQGVAVWG